MSAEFWPDLAFLALVAIFCLYTILDGMDLGLGMLVPFTRKRERADRLVNLLAPVIHGNEVWLVVGAAFLFAAFPAVYGTLLSAFYLPFMAAVGAFILRAAALEFSQHDEARRNLWRRLFGLSSALAAFMGLCALGALLTGLPLSAPGQLSGNLADYISPFPGIFAASGLAVLVWHGLAFAVSRHPSQSTLRRARTAWPIALGASLLAAWAWTRFLPATLEKPLVLGGGLVFLAGLLLGRLLLCRSAWAFACSCLSLCGLWIALGAALFPHILIARGHPEWNITISAASAPLASLKPLVIATLILVPLLLACTIFVYHVLQKKEH